MSEVTSFWAQAGPERTIISAMNPVSIQIEFREGILRSKVLEMVMIRVLKSSNRSLKKLPHRFCKTVPCLLGVKRDPCLEKYVIILPPLTGLMHP